MTKHSMEMHAVTTKENSYHESDREQGRGI